MVTVQQKTQAPTLRFDDFHNEWKETSIGEVSGPLSYGMNAAATQFDGENKYLRITDIDEKSRQYMESGAVSPLGELSDAYLLEEGDLLFARTGASTGKSFRYKNTDGKMYYAGFLIRARTNADFDSRFLYLQTLRQKYYQWVGVMSVRSGQPGINAKEYASYKFQAPSLAEQQKIADFFEALDQRIEAQAEKVLALKERKKAMMQKLFSQELRFRDENGQAFPDWANKRLVEVASVTMGQSPSGSTYNEEGKGMVLIQGNADMKKGKVVPRIYTTQVTKKCSPGDIIMSVRAPVGDVAITDIEACLGRGVCSIAGSPYIYQLLTHFNAIGKWNRIMQGSTFESVNGNDIKSLLIEIPSSQKEESKIGDFLSLLDEEIHGEDNLLNAYLDEKRAFMQQMLI